MNRMRRTRPFLTLLTTLAVLALPARAGDGKGEIIIRDAEIEATLKEWLVPLLKAAAMPSDSVDIVLVQDSQINAFVAGGANLFINTGLIEKTRDPGELIGVMAHELGHIVAGHLIATRAAYERASYESILGMALGIGAAVLTGNGQAANAITAGTSAMAANRYLAHSRVQESSADQAAMRFMEGAKINPSGLPAFFRTLESEELLPASQQSPYMRTHPITRDRIDAVARRVTESPDRDSAFPTAWTEQHARMKAKLMGFIHPEQIAWHYGDNDKSMAARYARAIAAYRQNRIDEALRGIDALIGEEPKNPYFQELKGQMLVDFGRVGEAIAYHRRAVDDKPNSGLLRIAYAHALLESGKASALSGAATQLERALQDEPRSARAHRLLATAYGRMGRETEATLHLAEEALLLGRIDYARAQAQSVISGASKGSREALKAQDILDQAEHMKRDREERGDP